MVLVILLIVAGLGFMMYKRFKNRLKKQRAKVADLTQMLQSRSQQKEEEEEEEEEKEVGLLLPAMVYQVVLPAAE